MLFTINLRYEIRQDLVINLIKSVLISGSLNIRTRVRIIELPLPETLWKGYPWHYLPLFIYLFFQSFETVGLFCD